MNAYKAYKTKQQQSTSSARVVAKLLEKAAEHMKAAVASQKENDIESRYDNSVKAADILSGLRGCLNHSDESAKNVAQTLQTFYDLLDEYICFFNVKQDIKYASGVIKALENMADAWQQIDDAQKAGSSAFNASVDKAAKQSMADARQGAYDGLPKARDAEESTPQSGRVSATA